MGMLKSYSSSNRLLLFLVGPILSLIAFVVTYYLDPLNFGEKDQLGALPAFLLSVLILIINHQFTTTNEVQRTSDVSDRIFEAIKDYMHVTSVGSPERAQEYINGRIPALREVQNTSFNIDLESERAEEKFYGTPTYTETGKAIKIYCRKSLIWKDLGDHYAADRFRKLSEEMELKDNGQTAGYNYKLIKHREPQINFIILEYQDGSREVLFNWDFRGVGQDPTVLLSREPQIVRMFAEQFTHLWRTASPDHDTTATKSVS